LEALLEAAGCVGWLLMQGCIVAKSGKNGRLEMWATSIFFRNQEAFLLLALEGFISWKTSWYSSPI
jgi:hypothetical protein